MKTSASLPGTRISRRAARKSNRAIQNIAAFPLSIALVAVALTAGCTNNGDTTTNAAASATAPAPTTADDHACANGTQY